MTADKLLHGKPVADSILEKSSALVERLRSEKGVTPCLATILVGEDPASAMYVNMKGKRCRSVGAEPRKVVLPASTTTQELVATIEELNNDASVHGILLQHPVPSQIDERLAFETIALEKDVDGVTAKSFGRHSFKSERLAFETIALEKDVDGVIAKSFGRHSFKMEAWGCATPLGIMRMLEYYEIDPNGMEAVIIGRSTILGQPMSQMLMNANATVTVCHSRTKDVAAHVARADLVVAAVGKPNFVKGDWIKSGAIVIDAGYNEGNVGDVDFEACLEKASRITPVPGGVGPCTIATLIEQGVTSAARVHGLLSGASAGA